MFVACDNDIVCDIYDTTPVENINLSVFYHPKCFVSVFTFVACDNDSVRDIYDTVIVAFVFMLVLVFPWH